MRAKYAAQIRRGILIARAVERNERVGPAGLWDSKTLVGRAYKTYRIRCVKNIVRVHIDTSYCRV